MCNSGRKKSARSPENWDKVNSLIQTGSKMSVRRIASATGVKISSVYFILRKDLRLKLYKPQILQELKEGNNIKRLAFCNWIEEMMQDNDFDPGDIIFSDESHVYLKCSPSKQNNRERRPTRPENRTSAPLHSAKVTVWWDYSQAKLSVLSIMKILILARHLL